jgi:hypothetical protein
MDIKFNMIGDAHISEKNHRKQINFLTGHPVCSFSKIVRFFKMEFITMILCEVKPSCV